MIIRDSSDIPWQIFYDEDMVFDISTAVAQHKNHYTWGQWNQFKMFSHYREDINITVTVVGSSGAHNTDDHVGLVLLDNIVITIRKDRLEDILLVLDTLLPSFREEDSLTAPTIDLEFLAVFLFHLFYHLPNQQF